MSLTKPADTAERKTALQDVERIASVHFAIQGKAACLSSERDETFLVKTQNGDRYVLKIANPEERFELLQMQAEALLHLEGQAPQLPIPRVVLSSNSKTMLPLAIGDGPPRLVRMLTFLDGVQLYRTARSKAQLASLGTALAALDAALLLSKIEVPKQELLWDIANAPALRSLVPETELSRRSTILRILDTYEIMASSALKSLPRQMIHNDFNPHNILVSRDLPDRVTGIIDFGDVVEAPGINDVAVALSYLVGSDTGLEDGLVFLRAYHRARQLSGDEITCLPTLLRTRLAMTLVITEWRAQRHPDNRDYILRNHPVALAGLDALAPFTDGDLASIFLRELGVTS